MNILVTGGAGFIGSALIRELIENSDHCVLNYDLLTYSGNLSSLNSVSNSPRYKFIQADICDESMVGKVLNEFQPTKIINLAAESHVDRSIDNPSPFIETNVVGTMNLLKHAGNYYDSLATSEKKDFVFHHVSTDEVYGSIPLGVDPCDESYPYNPSSPYAASKASSDHLVHAWHQTFKLPTIISNCSNNYGPFQFPEKLIPHTILNALDGKNIPIYGDGSQIRDWIYVEDHVAGLIKACFEGSSGETYNIGSSNEIRNIDTVQIICNILDDLVVEKPKNISSFHNLITFVDDRPGHDQRYAINSSKIMSELNWKNLQTFDSGINITIRWYLDNQKWWQEILEKNYSLRRLGSI